MSLDSIKSATDSGSGQTESRFASEPVLITPQDNQLFARAKDANAATPAVLKGDSDCCLYEAAAKGKRDPYDSVPYRGEVFKGEDGREYFWDFAAKDFKMPNDYIKLKKEHGDRLVDWRRIEYQNTDGHYFNGIILKWRNEL